MRPEISIIIPGRNCEKVITRCIDSIVNQSFKKPIEIIFIYDVSKDQTFKVVNDLALKYPFLKIIMTRRISVGYNRIDGIKAATGKYICFSDADDYYSNTMLEKMYNKITETKADVVNCAHYYVKDRYTKATKIRKNKAFDKYGALESLFKDTYLHGFMHTKMYRAEVLKDLVFYLPKYNFICEDYLMNFEIFKGINKLVCIKDPLYYYDKTGESFTNSSNTERPYQTVKVFALIRYLIDLEKDPKLLKIYRRYHLRRISSSLVDLFLTKKALGPNYKKVKKDVFASLKMINSKKPLIIKGQLYEEFINDAIAAKKQEAY